MAVFDVEQQRLCVRVVYDGMASAGKTTNLRLLAELFATQRTCELFSPAEMDGRTLYFDWVQIAAGMICGFPLLCQVITVPGQVVLTPRRRHLLATADVVVYVCDSDESATERSVEGLAPLARVEEERGERVPLVVQANKQDQPGALTGSALLAALGRPELPVVEAIASDGIGVVDTFVAAVRAGVRSIQARVDSGAVRVAVQRAERADEALERLAQVEVDPEWAAEMILEQAAGVFALDDANDDEAAIDEAPPTLRPEQATERPPLPTEHVPTGFIWPAHTGRAALRAMASEPEMAAPTEPDGDGAARVVLGEYVLSTSRDQRFATAEAARQALVRAARARTQLGPLLAPETVLVAQPASDGASWMWTILPRMPSLAHLASARDGGDLPRAAMLAAFAAALVDALKACIAHGMSLDLAPRSFGVRQGVVRYLGEIGVASSEGPSVPDAGRALEGALVSLGPLGDDLEAFVAAFESALASRLAPAEQEKLADAATWSDPGTLPAAARDACRRVEEALRRGRRAA